MVKQTQTICRLLPTNCLSVFDHFVGLALNRLRNYINSQLLYFLVFVLSSLLFIAFDFFFAIFEKKNKNKKKLLLNLELHVRKLGTDTILAPIVQFSYDEFWYTYQTFPNLWGIFQINQICFGQNATKLLVCTGTCPILLLKAYRFVFCYPKQRL